MVSFGSRRRGGGIGAIGIGILLFFGSFALLWWNEGRSAHREADLKWGQKNVLEIGSDKVDPSYTGKLIATQGMTEAGSVPEDTLFGIKRPSIRLLRKVEMYQWKETSRTRDDRTYYEYNKVWEDSQISSSNFHESGHVNPSMEYSRATFNADPVYLGAFQLEKPLIDQADNWQSVIIGKQELQDLPADFSAKSSTVLDGTSFYIKRTPSSSPASPRVGDYRVSFSIAPPAQTSLYAKQQGEQLTQFKNDKLYGPLGKLEVGSFTAQQLFEKAFAENNMLTWILRIAGCVAMFVGIMMVASPLTHLASYVPILGNLVGGVVAIFAIGVSLGLSLITIAVAWLRFRPVLGLVMLLIGGGLIIGGIVVARMIGGAKRDA